VDTPPGRNSIGSPSPKATIVLDADVACAAVENQRDAHPQVIADVLRGRRRNAAEAIGRGRGHGSACSRKGVEKRTRHRMRRPAQAYAILAAGDGVRNPGRAWQDQRERTGPERIGEPLCVRGISRAQSDSSALLARWTMTG
jgi:hypothetical protein